MKREANSTGMRRFLRDEEVGAPDLPRHFAALCSALVVLFDSFPLYLFGGEREWIGRAFGEASSLAGPPDGETGHAPLGHPNPSYVHGNPFASPPLLLRWLAPSSLPAGCQKTGGGIALLPTGSEVDVDPLFPQTTSDVLLLPDAEEAKSDHRISGWLPEREKPISRARISHQWRQSVICTGSLEGRKIMNRLFRKHPLVSIPSLFGTSTSAETIQLYFPFDHISKVMLS